MIAKYLLHLTPHLLTLIKTLRLKNYSQLLVWDETRSFLFGFIRKMIQQEKTQICSN